LFAGRASNDFYAALEDIIFVLEQEVSFAAAEDLGEHEPEILANLLEGRAEHLAGLVVDAVDDFEQLGLGRDEVVVLFAEELETFARFLRIPRWRRG